MEWVDYVLAHKIAFAGSKEGVVFLAIGGSPEPLEDAIGASFITADFTVQEAEKLRDELSAAIDRAKASLSAAA